MENERFLPSQHEKVLIVQNQKFAHEKFRQQLETLRHVVDVRDCARSVVQLKAMTVDDSPFSPQPCFNPFTCF